MPYTVLDVTQSQLSGQGLDKFGCRLHTFPDMLAIKLFIFLMLFIPLFTKFKHTYFVSENMLSARCIMINKIDTGSISWSLHLSSKRRYIRT